MMESLSDRGKYFGDRFISAGQYFTQRELNCNDNMVTHRFNKYT